MDEKLMKVVEGMRAGMAAQYMTDDVTGEEIYIPASSGPRRTLIYRPVEAAEGPLPVLIDVHGGGFVAGMPEMDDKMNRRIADELGIVVISPSYRLAPEDQYPADKEDVYDVVQFIHDNPESFGIDPERMAIGGHSAGGNIATVIAQMAKQAGDFAFKCVIMDYPTCDLDTDAHAKETPQGCLPPDMAAMFDLCYRDPARGKEIFLSPIFSTHEELVGMPPHIIITAEGDSLRGEAEEYAKKLMAAGTEVMGRRFAGVGHGFTISFMTANLPAEAVAHIEAMADQAMDMMMAGLKRHLLA